MRYLCRLWGVHLGQVLHVSASNIALAILCQVCLVHDKDSRKPRGYAFIEYQHTRDMKSMYMLLFGSLDGCIWW
jgi:RNA recognition motif-containing protein